MEGDSVLEHGGEVDRGVVDIEGDDARAVLLSNGEHVDVVEDGEGVLGHRALQIEMI